MFFMLSAWLTDSWYCGMQSTLSSIALVHRTTECLWSAPYQTVWIGTYRQEDQRVYDFQENSSMIHCYFALVNMQSIAVSVSACLSVCVCPLACLKFHTSKFHQIFCTCCLWLCLDLLWWQCNTLCTSGFVDVMFSHNGVNGQESKNFYQFARWRHRRRCLPSLIAFCLCWSYEFIYKEIICCFDVVILITLHIIYWIITVMQS